MVKRNCPFCEQALIAAKHLETSGMHPDSIYTQNKLIEGLDVLLPQTGVPYKGYPRCPKCNAIVGAVTEDTEGTSHAHECAVCRWKSEIYKGDYFDGGRLK